MVGDLELVVVELRKVLETLLQLSSILLVQS